MNKPKVSNPSPAAPSSPLGDIRALIQVARSLGRKLRAISYGFQHQ